MALPDDQPFEDARAGWEHPAVAAGLPVPGIPAWRPPLTAPLPADDGASARFLSATQLSALGRLPYYDPAGVGRVALRHAVLHDAPEPVRRLPDRRGEDVEVRRSVGTIVHRALQAWLLPDRTSEAVLVDSLRAYAWDSGLSGEAEIAWVVDRALTLLRDFERSRLRAELEQAHQVYRELPFVYHDGTRGFSGVIDVVYARPESKQRLRWCVLDYKTTPVGWQQAADHARRHFLQLGIYAKAIEERTGQTPDTLLYYIHPARRLYVKPAAWQAALARVEDDLQAALTPDEAR
jgi:hypothetical protein